MIDNHALALWAAGGMALALNVAALLLLFEGFADKAMTRRIRELSQGSDRASPRSRRLSSIVLSLLLSMGDKLRSKLLSPRDTEALTRTLVASGLDPSKAISIFMAAKLGCLIGVPAILYFAGPVLGVPAPRRILLLVFSVPIGLMLPNWVMALVRRSYQQALRRGIPDALDLLVICAEAGLGLDSALERVSQEMMKSNRPVGVEFSLFTNEMRIMPDRRTALANLAGRTGQPALKRLAGALSQTIRYGTPLAQGLRVLASEMRTEHLIQFEERAARLPALLTLPMILFILPCLFIVLGGQSVSGLLTLLAGINR
jgi:tight adherence protein C